MDKRQISQVLKDVTTKPAQEVETNLLAHIKRLEEKINELERRIDELENNPRPATFG